MNNVTITSNNNFVYQGNSDSKPKRGFEFVTGWENKTKLPARQTQNSSGYDFYLPSDIIIEPMESIAIESGIKAYMPSNEELLLSMRSKWGRFNKLILLAAKIDSDYYNNPDNEGHIVICVMNLGKEVFKLDKGERICQGTFYKYQTSNDIVNEIRNSGFGSTNK